MTSPKPTPGRESAADAMSELAREDLRVSGPAREALRISESRYRRLFETAQDGILLLNAETAQIEDVNPYLIKMLGYTHAEFLGKKLWEVGPFVDRAESKELFAKLQEDGYVRYEDLPLKAKSGALIEVEFVSNSYDVEGIKVIQCNIRNISTRRVIETKLLRQTHLYAALSQCNRAIVHSATAEELFQQVCRAAVDFGGMKMAWIGLTDGGTPKVRPVASFGASTDYLASLVISVDAASPYGCGPTGTAIRENRPYWCQDFMKDPATIPWREPGVRGGWGSSAALPLHRYGVVVGALCVYAGEANAFDAAARDLLVEMAADISFALGNFDREAQRRLGEGRLMAAEERFRGLVEQAIAGIYIIQDGRLAYVNPRAAEIVGQGATEELIGTDPLLWVATADRGQVAENLRRLLAGEARSLALDFAVLRRDGVMIQVGANATYATHEGRPAIIGMVQDISEKKRADAQIALYIEQLRAAMMGTVEVATILSELRDPYTAGHEKRVAALAAAIGAELGFDTQRQAGLRIAGYLHDIGKITIPSEILSKPGKLSPLEYQLVQGHAQASCDVLKTVEWPWPVAEIALQHHERMDGSGYPQGLKGADILPEARIMAVADVVEAMSSHRPYRAGLGIEKALEEIERGRGTAYDAAAVDACLRLFREQNYQIQA